MAYLSAIETERLWAIAKAIFPKEAAKAEAWVMAEAKRLGVGYAKEKVQEAATNPILWGALALGGIGLLVGLTRR